MAPLGIILFTEATKTKYSILTVAPATSRIVAYVGSGNKIAALGRITAESVAVLLVTFYDRYLVAPRQTAFWLCIGAIRRCSAE